MEQHDNVLKSYLIVYLIQRDGVCLSAKISITT